MKNEVDQACEYLIPFVINEISVEQKRIFVDHLQACDTCREEVRPLQEVWHTIPYECDEMQVPADLKEEVMNAIFSIPSDSLSQELPERLKWKKWISKSGWWAAALLFTLFTGTVWENVNLQQQLQQLSNISHQPAQILQQFNLNAPDPSWTATKGNVWLIQQGNLHKLIFHLEGLSVTKEQEAYQIWLIHDGKRKSAGVFYVDEKGNGAITYEMEESDLTFDSIGITLEPDPYGSQPRGKKVLGS